MCNPACAACSDKPEKYKNKKQKCKTVTTIKHLYFSEYTFVVDAHS